MSVSKKIIYVKADQNTEVQNREVRLGDVLKIECADPSVTAHVKTLKLFSFHPTASQKQSREVVSILKVIACIHETYPDAEIQNIGEADFIVTYEGQKNTGMLIKYLKVAVVVGITFCGAAFSTMAFNNDVDVTKMFGQIYELVTGKPSDGFTILELTYSIGITVGIFVFFNHFGKKRFTEDPTPIEVEMRTYEKDIQTTLVESYSRKEKELDVGRAGRSGNHRS